MCAFVCIYVCKCVPILQRESAVYIAECVEDTHNYESACFEYVNFYVCIVLRIYININMRAN